MAICFDRSPVIASQVAITLFFLVALIQVGIAAGWVPVTIVWGGSQEVLTANLRIASLMAAGILLAMAYIIHQRTIQLAPSSSLRFLSWTVTVYMCINTVGNFLSTNDFERFVFGSITSVLALCCGLVSSSNTQVLATGYEDLP
mmetsp:Transcript_2387/g.3383  ORF Transcript_2387/g.3383 Transcript_2387/m.3383 type:complete len:144 (+) Transcript_2387:113-544(+)